MQFAVRHGSESPSYLYEGEMCMKQISFLDSLDMHEHKHKQPLASLLLSVVLKTTYHLLQVANHESVAMIKEIYYSYHPPITNI